jgi:hypothetical protein
MAVPATVAPSASRKVSLLTPTSRATSLVASRRHLGSASWIEAPTFLGEFAQGAGEPEVETIQKVVSGARTARFNPVTVEG